MYKCDGGESMYLQEHDTARHKNRDTFGIGENHTITSM